MTNNKHLTVATYNIQFGINSEKIINNIKKLAEEGVNIFCLQEIINIHNEVFIIEKILKRLGNKWKASYHVGEEISKLSIGTAILWNSEILTLKNEEKLLLPKIKKFDFHEKLFYKVVGEEAITLQRKALSCYFTIDQQTNLRVTSIHIDNIGGPLHRMKQITYLITKLNGMKTPQSEIICGDFNTFDLLKTGYEKKLLQKKIGKNFVDASKKIDWTSDIYMADYLNSKLVPWFVKTFNVHIRRRLDYIWVRNVKVIFCKKRELHGSDHFPIVAELEL